MLAVIDLSYSELNLFLVQTIVSILNARNSFIRTFSNLAIDMFVLFQIGISNRLF